MKPTTLPSRNEREHDAAHRALTVGKDRLVHEHEQGHEVEHEGGRAEGGA